MLENGLFCRVDAGARLFLDEKCGMLRRSARLGASTAITKKKVVSVRVMRELSRRLAIFFSSTRKKCWTMACFAE